MKTISKIGVSAIGAAAIAGIGYLSKKAYDKKKDSNSTEVDVPNTTPDSKEEVSEEKAD